MSRNSFRILALSAALAFSSGCRVRVPDVIPALAPALADQPEPVPTGADFLQSVPSDRVLFEEDGFSLDAQDRAVLDSQAAWLLRYPGVTVTIEGHSDERGTREHALALANRRANAASAYLQSRGVPASRISVLSWGKERPAASGSDESSWAQNRRAVTVIAQ
ncbi:MAG TPA: OmpA family protein [Allosphingosinicella sp.]|nr:OmpA family protein [Allosphingosinicella sp.]